MRILLLGGNGFIGEHLTKKLSNRKNCEIIVVYDGKPLKSNFNRVFYVRLDLTKLNKKLEKIINSADIIIILTRPNRKIIENIILAANKKNCLKKILYLSSVLIYDNFNGKQGEGFPINPITDYERGKWEEELMLSKFIQRKKIKLCIARLTNVYGDVKSKGLVNNIFLSIFNNKELFINGIGDSVRDYIFVEDVVAWLDFLIFWDQKNKKEIINVCTGKGYSVIEVLKKAKQIFGKKVKAITGTPIQEKKMIIGNNKKIVNISKMKSKYNLTEGLKRTYKNYLKYNYV